MRCVRVTDKSVSRNFVGLDSTLDILWPLVPKIQLEKSKGLSLQLVTQLQTELETLAVELKGEVMIFELAQHVQKFLHQHNKPRFKSFYEEMMSRKEQQQQQLQLINKQKEDKQRQAIQDEIQRRQEALKEEQRRRRGQSRSVPDASGEDDKLTNIACHPSHIERSRSCGYVVNNSISRRSRSHSKSEGSESCSCNHKGTKLIIFTHKAERHIYRGMCLSHSPRGSVTYRGMDALTGEVVTIVEWSFKCKQKIKKKVTFCDDTESDDLANLMKQVTNRIIFWF
ncbi:hypothetical protein C0J52_21450 [Blattella germanica]|nr:hypothetical protein C0J52_21450 [Blattella germanica]